MIEITPSRVIRSAAAVREHGSALGVDDPPSDPGNAGFRTSAALRSWRGRAQQDVTALASSTAALADKLEASARALQRADEDAADAAIALERAVAA